MKKYLTIQNGQKHLTPLPTKTINFQFFGLPINLERVMTTFPYDGVIKKITATCSAIGSQDTILKVQKISDTDFKSNGSWSDILSSNINIVSGNLFDDGNYVVGGSNITKNDRFRISCVSGNAQNISIQIEIELI